MRPSPSSSRRSNLNANPNLLARMRASALAGRIDAIAYEGAHTEAVIDWKSDIEPDEMEMRRHATQLEDYMRATGALRGALVCHRRARDARASGRRLRQ
jgi:hypothetical protein